MEMFQFFPVPFIIGLLIISYLAIHDRKRGWQFLISSLLFEAYLLFVVSEVFFPIPYSTDWPQNLSWANSQAILSKINWIPFHYSSRYFDLNPIILTLEITGNILFTLPFGFGCYFLFPSSRKHFILLSITTGLTIEGLQLLLCLGTGYAYHSTDVNDVLLNALGVMLGYSLAKLLTDNHRPARI